MRKLLILRGAPGAGKSTWVRENNLELYTLCPDNIRLMCGSIASNVEANITIPRDLELEKKVWTILFEMLEYRMKNGEFTVIDATASKTKDISQYKTLAEKYKYKLYCVDFTDVPLEVCKAQNKQRPAFKIVPDESIDNIYSRFEGQKVPSGVVAIKPHELSSVFDTPIDLSVYSKLVFIGDIHGCYDTLMQYPDFKNGLKDDTEYIFLGDYIDRGNQNEQVMFWLDSIKDKPNVCLLEGNHERWLAAYGNKIEIKSKEFSENTLPKLIGAGYTPKMARMFYRKLRQMSHISYNGLEILACHGGIPFMTGLDFVSTKTLINGVGDYADSTKIAETWTSKAALNQFLIHGHRNILDEPIRVADRVFNLEGKVEFGGALRIVELNKNLTWNEVYLNDAQPITEDLNTDARAVDTVDSAISYLRNNKFIVEKKLNNNVSSFNFSREAFLKRNWTTQTILARGLFIDTDNKIIKARSYEKFFRIEEHETTMLDVLCHNLKFPVTAYVKENGFLAIVSYDYTNDSLFIASKSTDSGKYVDYIKKQLKPYYFNVLQYVRDMYHKNKPVTLVFECEDIACDPHIIKYSKDRLVLLDIIKNTLTFETAMKDNIDYYKYLTDIANKIGCPVKEKAFIINTWEQFINIYNKISTYDYKYNNQFIEGFVFEDSNGFQTKCKTGYYNLWKKLRGVAEQTLKYGYYLRTGLLQEAVENDFYNFCKNLYKTMNATGVVDIKNYKFKTDIISLRDQFMQKLQGGIN